MPTKSLPCKPSRSSRPRGLAGGSPSSPWKNPNVPRSRSSTRATTEAPRARGEIPMMNRPPSPLSRSAAAALGDGELDGELEIDPPRLGT